MGKKTREQQRETRGEEKRGMIEERSKTTETRDKPRTWRDEKKGRRKTTRDKRRKRCARGEVRDKPRNIQKDRTDKKTEESSGSDRDTETSHTLTKHVCTVKSSRYTAVEIPRFLFRQQP